MKPTVIIIGGGPAGLTAALELVRDGRMQPIVLEAGDDVGGLSRTVEYKGNRMDIGGHRFFSKSDWVMNWWREILPIAADQAEVSIAYRGRQRKVGADDTAIPANGRALLVRKRLSRIYFLRRYFDYPIALNATTLRNLGPLRLLRIGASYLSATLFPRRPERSLEDFLVNRFGAELYRTFFKDYTEKVWGVPCEQIGADWGAQRIKGLSVFGALRHALKQRLKPGRDEAARNTSLIEQFLYPRLGPGQLWREVAERVIASGGEVRLGQRVVGLRCEANRVIAVQTLDAAGRQHELLATQVISTMPIKDLVAGMQPPPPPEIAAIAAALPYRDFITVGLLLSGMRANPRARSARTDHMPPDNWIYIQERDVRVGRLQVFNNWSPDLVADPGHIWLGLEYFCNAGDDLWQLDDPAMMAFAADELERIGMIDRAAVLDGTVLRVPKTYPGYFGAYAEFPRLRAWLDPIPNLFLVGRNGMHRYNNQDHSMLTAKCAVDAILSGSTDKQPIWDINVDDDYHEDSGAQA
jgi:protoporphyrinogen oxidase